MHQAWMWLGVGSATLGTACGVQAQEWPDPGALLQQQRQLQAAPRALSPAPATLPDADRSESEAPGLRLRVRGFVIEDAQTLSLPEPELMALLEPAVGQELTLAELRRVAGRITQTYRERGQFLARAVLPAQDVSDGMVRVRVLESRLARTRGVQVQREGTGRMDLELARRVAAEPLTPGAPLHLGDVERGLQLLHDLPGVGVSGHLEPGDDAGETRLVIDLSDQPLLRGMVGADNHGSRYTQSHRASAALVLDNPSGMGDEAALQLVSSPNRDYRYLSLRYGVLLNAGGLRAEGSASGLQYRVGQELAVLDVRGRASAVGLSLQQPLLRNRATRLTAWAGGEHKSLRAEALATPLSRKRLIVGSAGLTLEHTGADGDSLLAEASLASGTLNLGASPPHRLADQSPQGPHTEGAFHKLMAQVQYQHALTPRLSLLGAGQGQWASTNLDSAEKFILGGPAGVRAYASGEGSGDSGLRLSGEARLLAWQLPQAGPLYLSAFADWGYLRQWRKPTGLALNTPNGYALKGAGVAATLLMPQQGVSASLVWARSLGANPARDPATGLDANGQNRRSRLWAAIQARF